MGATVARQPVRAPFGLSGAQNFVNLVSVERPSFLHILGYACAGLVETGEFGLLQADNVIFQQTANLVFCFRAEVRRGDHPFQATCDVNDANRDSFW